MHEANEETDNGMNPESIENPWTLLEPPLIDLFQSVIVPSYLTLSDLLHLSAVSRRYRSLFRTSGSAKLAVSAVLKRDATHYLRDDNNNVCYPYMDQLPTFDNYKTPEEALRGDPWMVAKLQVSALRRRRLVLLNPNSGSDDGSSSNNDDMTLSSSNEQEDNWRILTGKFQPPSLEQLGSARQHRTMNVRESNRSGFTQFLCFNECNVNVYCHWIDRDGGLLVREGDCIPPMPTSVNNENQTTSERRRSSLLCSINEHDWPRHVFRHNSYAYHSFALCLHEGGPPFAIYQQRRCWNQVWNTGLQTPPETFLHCHAIAIVPTATDERRRQQQRLMVEEVHCNRVITYERDGLRHARSSSFQFILYDRSTGIRLPFINNQQGNGRTQLATDARIDPNDLAREYYGVNVPKMDHSAWQGRSGTALASRIISNSQLDEDNASDEDRTNYLRFIRGRIDEWRCRGPSCYVASFGEILQLELEERESSHQ